ncbi:MAG: hypothetical protein ACJA07_001948 [Rhodococcus sp. (in: high G+C Gram-positive bacteria)]|jgi:hypothetical protein
MEVGANFRIRMRVFRFKHSCTPKLCEIPYVVTQFTPLFTWHLLNTPELSTWLDTPLPS